MTDLKNKAIKIQGKDYVLVKDRVLAFNEVYPNGSIQTQLVEPVGTDRFVIKAIVIPDTSEPNRVFTGYSQAVIGDSYINKTAALENAETSAVGRALAMMGIGVLDSIASADEMHKATANVSMGHSGSSVIGPKPVSTLTSVCKIHNAKMYEFMSKTGKPYFAHKDPNGQLCFGKESK